MAAENACAIVLRSIDFSETSSVVTFYTRECGKLGALAKGARRLKNPFDSALDVLTRCRIVFLRKSSGGLDLLTEAKLERRFRPPGRSLAPLYAAYYVAELLQELTDLNDPHPKLFDAADDSLLWLSEGRDGAPDVAPIVLRFEMVALQELGHLPNLNHCVECGEPVEPAGRIAFGQLAGGVLCARCRPGKKYVVSLSPKALVTMRQFAAVNDDVWRREDMASGVRGELRGVLNNYFNHLVGHRLKMHAYLEFGDR
jgi:DNA repair protein RecO (recombination protein O)